jgi:hypothetical protein
MVAVTMINEVKELSEISGFHSSKYEVKNLQGCSTL